jgi:hypothetical protein
MSVDVQRTTQAAHVKVGEWVAAIYDDNWYPGDVESITSSVLEVNLMEKRASWKIPIDV